MVLVLEGFLVNDIEDWDEKIPVAEAVQLANTIYYKIKKYGQM